jgi:hypothetical protein
MSSPAFFTEMTPAPETTAIARDDTFAEAVRVQASRLPRAHCELTVVDSLGSRSERERRRMELRSGTATS